MADLLTEKREEILSANKKDMELAINSGTVKQLENVMCYALCLHGTYNPG